MSRSVSALELVTETNGDSNGRRIFVFLIREVVRISDIGSSAVNVGALAEVIGVADRNRSAGGVVRFARIDRLIAVSRFSVNVGQTDKGGTAKDRRAGRQSNRITLQLFRVSIRCCNGLHGTHILKLNFVKVLDTAENLGNTEVVIAAEGHRQTVVNLVSFFNELLFFTVPSLIIRRINCKIQSTSNAFKKDYKKSVKIYNRNNCTK